MRHNKFKRIAILLTILAIVVAILWAYFHFRNRLEMYSPPAQSKTSECIIKNALPDPACSPGAVDKSVTWDMICPRVTRERHTLKSMEDEVLRSYNMSRNDGVKREQDHVIPIELAGSDNNPANHFPQAYDGELGAHAKDHVENWLHRRVCRGELELAIAQELIATDWVAVYREYQQAPKKKRTRSH